MSANTGTVKIEIRVDDKGTVKVKKFSDGEFKIIGANEDIGKHAGQCTFVCEVRPGVTFKCKPKGTAVRRAQYWIDFKAGLLTNKMLTVRYFGWTTSDPPEPRFPVGIAIRDYE